MTHTDRRRVLKTGLAALLSGAASRLVYAGQSTVKASLKLDPTRVLNRIPASYSGLSIETMTLEDPSVYHADNHRLIALLRRLNPQGVLRIGGNSSEFCWWKASADAQPPQIKAAGVGRSDNWMPQQLHAITPQAVDNLRGFLDASGWSCIYGLNFGTGAPARDAEEAAYVARALGPKLRYFQIGNEPDLYRKASNLLRPPGWDFDDYVREWLAIAHAVIERVPNAKFGGPDVGGAADWVTRFGEQVPDLLGKERLAELTGHYYAEGPPDSPSASIENLLATDQRVADRMNAIMPVARTHGLTFRMSEGNSCYRGGKAGMSNALASALWGFDYMLEMASLGCVGVNLHGGGGKEISASLGNKLPGARDARDLEIAKLGTFYAPIAGNRQIGYHARPIFYGMMAMQQFADADLVATQFEHQGVNATAYAAKRAQGWCIAVVNKDLQRDLSIDVEVPTASKSATLWRLAGPALDATDNITLAGAQVTSDAHWDPSQVLTVPIDGSRATIDVRHASAALLFVA
jgi:hypothetical protein